MKVPDKFPPGCVFGMDRADGDGIERSYVKFPDGKVFFLDEKAPWNGLTPANGFWPSDWSEMTEAEFLSAARATL